MRLVCDTLLLPYYYYYYWRRCGDARFHVVHDKCDGPGARSPGARECSSITRAAAAAEMAPDGCRPPARVGPRCLHPVHVATAVDGSMLPALPAFLYSLLASTRRGCVLVHILVPKSVYPTGALQEAARRARRACIEARLHPVDGEAHLLLRRTSAAAKMNLVRFYLPSILSVAVDKVRAVLQPCYMLQPCYTNRYSHTIPYQCYSHTIPYQATAMLYQSAPHPR